MAVAAMGLVPMSPFTEVTPVVVTPDLVRTAKSAAVPRTTGSVASCSGAAALSAPWKLSARSSEPRESTER
eukprot:scaffold113891_cov69-Phaeocystis_antarctica.AAC.2